MSEEDAEDVGLNAVIEDGDFDEAAPGSSHKVLEEEDVGDELEIETEICDILEYAFSLTEELENGDGTAVLVNEDLDRTLEDVDADVASVRLSMTDETMENGAVSTIQETIKHLDHDDTEAVSVTDQSAASQTERTVHSEPVETDTGLDFSFSVNLYDNSLVETLFKKSPVPYRIADESDVRVTVFLPDNQSITSNYPGNINVFELKKHIAEKINSEPDKLQISLLGNSSGLYINDWIPLLGILPNSVGGLVLNLSFKFDVNVQNVVNFPSPGKYAPIITVRQVLVKDSSGREKVVNVVTEDISYIKEWLGGFRNTKTGQMFHNATTETRFWDSKSKSKSSTTANSRDAQTHLPYLTKTTQVDANKATQMWRPDHYVQAVGDKVLTAKPYSEYDLRPEHRSLLDSVIKIQRWFRRLRSRRRVRDAFFNLIDLMKENREKKTAAEAHIANEKMQYLVGVCFPTTRNDFFNLYSIIGIWWKKQYQDILKIKSISERRAAHYNLLQDEINLLSALEKQRIKSKVEALQRRDLKLLEETTRPIIRHQRKRNMTIVETLEIQRAREIKEMFMTYARTDLDKKERIEVIMGLINLVTTIEDKDLTKDVITLMRREIDMISMGLETVYLQGLKKRIEEGLLHFVRDKDFNPQAKNFRPIIFPRVDQRSYRCKGCHKLKNPADFNIHVRLKAYKSCRSCDWMQVTAHKMLNISPYAKILKLLRANEITKCPRSTYCFALQPYGAYFIVNTLWNGKSALSETMSLPDLRLCRWDNKLEWSPWNAILLTDEEAAVHERIYDNSQVYEEDFIQAVKLKHITTKFHFKVMDETEIYSREIGLWDTAIDENIYQHVYHRRGALQPTDPVFKPPLNKAYVPSRHVKQQSQCRN